MIEKFCKNNLTEISNLIQQLSPEQYQQPLPILSGSSIGQHVRHITEFYVCLINGIYKKEVNYDQRERDLRLESDLKFVIYTLDKIRTNLPCGVQDFPMQLRGNFADHEDESISIPTSFFRELAYCLEHSIHHQALLKIGLIELGKVDLIDDQFGVAPATIRFKTTLASA